MISNIPDHAPRKSRSGKWLLVLLVPISLVALFYAEEDFRHLRAWRNYLNALRSEEKPLNWKEYLPKPVPDAENFAKIPLFEAIGYKERPDQAAKNLAKSIHTNGAIRSASTIEPNNPALFDHFRSINAGSYVGDLGHRTRLEAFASELQSKHDNLTNSTSASAIVLDGMKPVEKELNELRTASSRPFAQFDAMGEDPWNVTMPNAVTMRMLSQVFGVRASAFLDQNKPDEALKDLRVLHRISDAMKSHNTLVTAMIRVAIQGLGMGPFWEGWLESKWTQEQYAELQSIYEQIDLLATVSTSIAGGERAGIHYIVENYSGEQLAKVFFPYDHADKFKEWLRDYAVHQGARFAPRGWRYRSLMVYDEIIRQVMAQCDSVKQRIDPLATRKSMSEIDRILQQPGPFKYLLASAMPNFSKVAAKTAGVQTQVNFARVVCALERFRHDNKDYPQKLNQLVPKYIRSLPHDLVTGEPLKYGLEKEGRFLMYATGLDGKDDGGLPVGFDSLQGDWVWPVYSNN